MLIFVFNWVVSFCFDFVGVFNGIVLGGVRFGLIYCRYVDV